ncbi:MAG: PD40 domain-containing protein, partial [Anaerolineaceae bacterium]|nr:PD40 domain-containing protein [Anaerolineaceae bacterium]
ALTGVIPEDGLARATGKAQLTPLRQIQPKIDRRLAAVIEKSLEVEPEDRFQSAADLKVALIEAGNLSQLTQQRPLVSPPPPDYDEEKVAPAKAVPEALYGGAPKSSKRRRAQRRAWVLGSILTILLVLAGSAYYLQPPIPASWLGWLPQQPFPSPSISPSAMPSVSSTVVLLPTETEIVQNTPVITPEASQTLLPVSSPVIIKSTATVPQPVPLGGADGEIAFVSKRTGTMQIWTMKSDGTQQRQLTNLTQGACQPHWSPDGKQLAIISPCYKKDLIYTDSKIYILNADGSNPKPLPVGQEGDFDPAWSPDGKRLAFSSIRTGVPHIFVYNFEDNSLSELSDTRFSDIQPAWSPGGKQLAISRKNLYYHIWIISDLGQTQFQYSSSGDVNDLWPVWSHDNQFIMYGRSRENPFLPWLLKLNYEDRGSGREERIPNAGTADFGRPIAAASLSPDQQWFAYEGWPDGNNHDIYIKSFNVEESAIRLTTDPELDFSPVWKPAALSN